MKINKKVAAIILGGITLTSLGCKNLLLVDNEENIEIATQAEEEPTLPIVDVDSVEYNTNIINVVKADINTPIMDGVFDNSKILGTFVEGREFTLISDEDPDWYAIRYYDKYGFVKKEDAHIEYEKIIADPIISKGYLPNGGIIYTTEKLDSEKGLLEELEFVEIYADYGDSYLVSTLNYDIGFVKKEDISLLEGDLALVDITDQNVVF